MRWDMPAHMRDWTTVAKTDNAPARGTRDLLPAAVATRDRVQAVIIAHRAGLGS